MHFPKFVILSNQKFELKHISKFDKFSENKQLMEALKEMQRIGKSSIKMRKSRGNNVKAVSEEDVEKM